MLRTREEFLSWIRMDIADSAGTEREAQMLLDELIEDLQKTSWKYWIRESRQRRKKWVQWEEERRQKRAANRDFLLVQRNCRRAKVVGLPHSLTLDQWMVAVKHFNGLCAYCQKAPYDTLEHFLSLSLGGGTTTDNCVPSCTGCNNKKRNYPPDALVRIFSQETLDRIYQFFASQR